MRLGEYAAILEALPLTARVMFDFGMPPAHLDSWRGVYSQCTLTHQHGEKSPTVAELLVDVRLVLGGSIMHGYKGGEYTMDPDRSVWADDSGDVDYRIITGIELQKENGFVVIETMLIPEYTEL